MELDSKSGGGGGAGGSLPALPGSSSPSSSRVDIIARLHARRLAILNQRGVNGGNGVKRKLGVIPEDGGREGGSSASASSSAASSSSPSLSAAMPPPPAKRPKGGGVSSTAASISASFTSMPRPVRVTSPDGELAALEALDCKWLLDLEGECAGMRSRGGEFGADVLNDGEYRKWLGEYGVVEGGGGGGVDGMVISGALDVKYVASGPASGGGSVGSKVTLSAASTSTSTSAAASSLPAPPRVVMPKSARAGDVMVPDYEGGVEGWDRDLKGCGPVGGGGASGGSGPVRSMSSSSTSTSAPSAPAPPPPPLLPLPLPPSIQVFEMALLWELETKILTGKRWVNRGVPHREEVLKRRAECGGVEPGRRLERFAPPVWNIEGMEAGGGGAAVQLDHLCTHVEQVTDPMPPFRKVYRVWVCGVDVGTFPSRQKFEHIWKRNDLSDYVKEGWHIDNTVLERWGVGELGELGVLGPSLQKMQPVEDPFAYLFERRKESWWWRVKGSGGGGTGMGGGGCAGGGVGGGILGNPDVKLANSHNSHPSVTSPPTVRLGNREDDCDYSASYEIFSRGEKRVRDLEKLTGRKDGSEMWYVKIRGGPWNEEREGRIGYFFNRESAVHYFDHQMATDWKRWGRDIWLGRAAWDQKFAAGLGRMLNLAVKIANVGEKKWIMIKDEEGEDECVLEHRYWAPDEDDDEEDEDGELSRMEDAVRHGDVKEVPPPFCISALDPKAKLKLHKMDEIDYLFDVVPIDWWDEDVTFAQCNAFLAYVHAWNLRRPYDEHGGMKSYIQADVGYLLVDSKEGDGQKHQFLARVDADDLESLDPLRMVDSDRTRWRNDERGYPFMMPAQTRKKEDYHLMDDHRFRGRLIFLHRVVAFTLPRDAGRMRDHRWDYLRGPMSQKVVDHVYGDLLDARSSQLRIISRRENFQNLGPASDNMTGITGIKLKYLLNGQQRYVVEWKEYDPDTKTVGRAIGRFKTLVEAAHQRLINMEKYDVMRQLNGHWRELWRRPHTLWEQRWIDVSENPKAAWVFNAPYPPPDGAPVRPVPHLGLWEIYRQGRWKMYTNDMQVADCDQKRLAILRASYKGGENKPRKRLTLQEKLSRRAAEREKRKQRDEEEERNRGE